MAINTATIQHRRGSLEDFNPEKLMPGEIAVITDERSVHMGFPGGGTERIILEKDFTSESIKEKLGYEPADEERVNQLLQKKADYQYVNEKVSNVKVDLTGYAKEDYVDAEIEELNKKIVRETGKLSNDIEDVNNYFEECIKKGFLDIDVAWEFGGTNGGDGENAESDTRIRSSEWIRVDRDFEIHLKKGYKADIVAIETNGSGHSFNYDIGISQKWLGSATEDTVYTSSNINSDNLRPTTLYFAIRIMLTSYNDNVPQSLDFADNIRIGVNAEIGYIPQIVKEYVDEKTMKTYENMKVVTFGDSMFLYGNRGDDDSWQYVIKNYFGFKELISVGVGGTGYKWWTTSDRNFDMPSGHRVGDNLPFSSGISNTAQHNGAFCSWYRIANTIPSDTDLIIIGTGTNDFGASDIAEDLSDLEFVVDSNTDTEWANSKYYSMYGGDYKITTLRGAILSTIMKMQVIAPNAMIVFVNFPNTRLVDGTGKNGTATYQPDLQKPILDALEYVHKWWGIPYIDVLGTCGINPLNRAKYTADNIHCNTLGYSKMFANAVISGLKTILN